MTRSGAVTATRHPRLGLALLLCVAWLGVPRAEAAARFEVLEASTRLVDEVYRLDARIDLEFSPEVREALESGVPLTVELQIEVHRRRDLLWDPLIASLSQRYELVYRALSDLYLVTNVNTGERNSYPSRRAASDALGMIRDFPMLDRRLLQVGATHTARLRATLDIEALPLPLRPVAYLSDAWDLTSEWHEWLLEP